MPVDWTLVGRLVVRETLTLFCLKSSSTIIFLFAMQEKRQAAQERQKLNDAPHILSQGGYDLLKEKMMKARMEAAGAESTDQVSPPRRHELWKAVRTKRDGHMTSESARAISERIVSKITCFVEFVVICKLVVDDFVEILQDDLVEQSTQGLFVPHG